MKFCFTEHDLPNPNWDDPGTSMLSKQMFLDAGHVEVPVADADIVINLNDHWMNGTNVVFASWEPPFHEHVRSCYLHPELYHSIFRFGPCDPGKGEFPITTDPVVFPYHPHASGPDIVREDTTLRGRRVFFAGMSRFHEIEDTLGRVGLYKARTHLVHDLRSQGVDVYAEGPDFGRDSRDDGRVPRWDLIKLNLCRDVLADFHLCCENCQLEGYVSEKIHHGFQTDLVVLYLGNPDIHKWVPSGAFINLNEYLDPGRRRVNAVAVADVIMSMTQSEYDAIIHKAREWRREAAFLTRYDVQVKRITQMILDRLDGVL